MLRKRGIPPKTLYDINDITMPQDEFFLRPILEAQASDLPVASLRTNRVHGFMKCSDVFIG